MHTCVFKWGGGGGVASYPDLPNVSCKNMGRPRYEAGEGGGAWLKLFSKVMYTDMNIHNTSFLSPLIQYTRVHFVDSVR